MKIKELAEYCKSIEIDCYKCKHKDECDRFTNKVEEISPFGAVELVEENKDI